MSGTRSPLLCVFCVVMAAGAQEPLYKKVSDSVTLTTGSSSVTDILSIVWYQGDNLAMDWDGSTSVDAYRQFKVRGSLNLSTGAMTIKDSQVHDNGMYKVQINGQVVNHIHLKVIFPVPKPTVKPDPRCDSKNDNCELRCHGNTLGVEQVHCSWQGDGLPYSNTTCEHTITKERDSKVKEIKCKMTNPVSEELSEPFPNPFYVNKVIVGLVVFIVLCALPVMLVFFHRCKTGTWFFASAFMPWQAGFWRKQKEGARITVEANTEDPSPMEAADSNGPSAAAEKRAEGNK
ncbi:uncharacterized protein LOC130131673 [Lampris incognitus]|uniref:uncharacterized protein LOC130131673 n=1 Tax=Lampris incognitus TaxID=2546036 RepID=UPI0024B5E5E0|nr:uncharacterized protein LOC130131673 [Lampris incognitus]